MSLPAFDEGSFRDPEGHVFNYENKIYRTLNPMAVERMKALISLPFFKEWMDEGRLIPTQLLTSTETFPKGFAATEHILWHEKVSSITYPFEWTFSMLKDAALLTLDLMETLLTHNFILKDGTAWNLCFYKGRPCFYDILSIDEYKDGQPWEGLSQFLQEFLYPLMLQAYHGFDFQPLWRSTQQGIPVSLLYKTLSKKALFKKGVFKYVYLQEKFSSNKSISEASLRQEFSANAFPKQALTNMIKDLRKCIESLQVTKDQSVWKGYDSKNSYEKSDTREKENFIEEGLKLLKPSALIDLGCNTGHYSFIAAKTTQVISCDLDPTCVDYIFLQKNPNILPVVLNLMTPSPSMGWDLKERKDVFSRLKADSFLALALMHHICISHNVPLERFILFLKSIAPQGILEWVDKSDPMVQFLLRNRTDIFKEYTWENFQSLVSQQFHIQKSISLNNGTRKLLLLSEK
jgi:ribosomal protein L11 methylase PrmA